jgi:hypothetical protein
VPCGTSRVVPGAHRVVGSSTHRGSGPREVHTTPISLDAQDNDALALKASSSTAYKLMLAAPRVDAQTATRLPRRHGRRPCRAPQSGRLPRRLSCPPPPQDLPGAPRAVNSFPPSCYSPVQGKPRPSSPSAAAATRRRRPNSNRAPKPSLGMPLDLPEHLRDLELRRGHQNSTGSTAPCHVDHIALI